MARNITFGLALSGLLALLTACGYDPGTRAVTGGLMGAGAGAGAATELPSPPSLERRPSIASPVGNPQTEQWTTVDGMGCSQMGQLDGTFRSFPVERRCGRP